MKRAPRTPLTSVLATLLLGFASPLAAQSLEEKLEEKLSHDFIEYGGWITDFDEAKAKAKEEDKLLFVYFSRSYAP